MNETSASLNWPDDYRTWSGTIKDLADTAARVLAVLEPDAKAPNVRLLRYYQQAGVIGRGTRQGNQAIFGFDDLERVVAAKGLVSQNWTLEQAVSLMDTHHEPVSQLLYADPSVALASPKGAATSSGASAQDVVARLMAKAGPLSRAPHPSPPARPVLQAQGALLPAASSGRLARAATPSPSPPPSSAAASSQPQPMLGVHPAPWMTVYLDESAARRASAAERDTAIQALLFALRSLS